MTEETRTGGVQGRWKIPVTPRRAAAFERDPEVVRKYGSKAGWAPWSLRFWRGLAVGFCVFSIIGHWIEIPYCLFNDWAFGIVDDNSLVFADPMYPFCVYGIASVLCALLLVPQRDWLAYRYQPRWRAVLRFWLFAVLASMVGELSMGLLLNQPDPVTGVYPLWDNSYLPLNVLGQAWLVNDVLLGTLVTLYIWVLYPTLVKSLGALPESWGWPITIAVVVSFVILCVMKF